MPKIVNKRARIHKAAAHISKRSFAHGAAVERILPTDNNEQNHGAVNTAATAALTPSGAVALDDNTNATNKRDQRRRQLLARLETTQNDILRSKKQKQKNSSDKSKQESGPGYLLADWTELSRTVQGLDVALQMKEKGDQPNKQPSIRKRKTIAKNERMRFQAVLDHPAFKANPLAAIRQHVENTFGKSDTN
ncbi:ribosome biogenesis protein SLX9-domain-containing protein [Syncephalis fuscata]|nr:ribosome biogenesis protein SLX9-domain-containing protein [Syncephalis fuscata]